MSPRLSVRSAVILAVLFGLLVPALLLTAIALTQVRAREVRETAQSDLERNARMLAVALAEPVWNLDRASAARIVDALMLRPEVHAVQVRENLEGTLVERRRAGSQGNLYAREALILREQQALGVVRVEVSDAPAQRETLYRLYTIAALLALQALAAFVLIWLVLHFRLINPLRSLGEHATRLASGDLSQALAPLHNDEIGALVHHLEQLRTSLQQALGTLAQRNRALEHELAERLRAEATSLHHAKRAQTLLEHSPIAVMELSLDGEIEGWNLAATRLFGWSREAVLQRSVGLLLPEHSEHDLAKLLRDEDDTPGGWCVEMDNLRHNGSVLRCRWTNTLIRDPHGQAERILAMTEDISEAVRAQQALEALNEQLEGRVRERTATLEKALDELRLTQSQLVQSAKLAALGELVAGVAHELNTPIGNGLMVASTIQDSAKRLRSDLQRGLRRSTLDQFLDENDSAADILARNLRRAAELVASFKQVAVDQTSSQRRRFELDELVREILITLQPMLKKLPHSIHVDIPAGLMLNSFPGPLGQVLTNLINNAVIHGLEHSSAGKIHIAAEAHDADKLSISVSDDGCGIQPEHLAQVFDPFFTTKRGRQGSGLGLHIVHNIVSGILGGHIRVDSSAGSGTRFIATLPFNAPQRTSPPSSS